MNSNIFKTEYGFKFDLRNRFCAVDDIINIIFHHTADKEKQHCVVTKYCEDYIEVSHRKIRYSLGGKHNTSYLTTTRIKPEDISDREISLEDGRRTLDDTNCLKFLVLKEIQTIDMTKLCDGSVVEYKTVYNEIPYRGIVKGMLFLGDYADIHIGRLPFCDDKNITYDIITLNDILNNKAYIKVLSK